MTHMSSETLTDELASLAAGPPSPLRDRVFAGVVQADGPEPVGLLLVAFTDRGVCYVRPGRDPEGFAEQVRERFGRPVRPAGRGPRGLGAALRRGSARDLELDLRGLSPFEQGVLRKAAEIPRGETRPYAWIAAEVGRPRAVRAAGSALGHNPVPILVPCHRVVLSDGREGEYIFGAETKRRLLAWEEVDMDEARELAAAGTRFLASDTTGIVCYPTCHDARRITPRHRVGFRSLARALDAGYRPCSRCRPAGPGPA